MLPHAPQSSAPEERAVCDSPDESFKFHSCSPSRCDESTCKGADKVGERTVVNRGTIHQVEVRRISHVREHTCGICALLGNNAESGDLQKISRQVTVRITWSFDALRLWWYRQHRSVEIDVLCRCKVQRKYCRVLGLSSTQSGFTTALFFQIFGQLPGAAASSYQLQTFDSQGQAPRNFKEGNRPS